LVDKLGGRREGRKEELTMTACRQPEESSRVACEYRSVPNLVVNLKNGTIPLVMVIVGVVVVVAWTRLAVVVGDAIVTFGVSVWHKLSSICVSSRRTIVSEIREWVLCKC